MQAPACGTSTPTGLLHQPGRRPQQGRYQYVLDYSNPDVVDWVFHRLVSVLDGAGVDYIKWDMNRSISDAYSCAVGPAGQGAVLHRLHSGSLPAVQSADRALSQHPV